MACTSSSAASKNVVTLPSFDTLRTLPSLPLPAHSEPSGAATIDHRNGAEVSPTTDAAGPRNIRPSLSIDRSSTSPLRKSACDETVQKVGLAPVNTMVRTQTDAQTNA